MTPNPKRIELLTAYTLQFIGPLDLHVARQTIEPRLLREAEENLTDLLPAGYRVEIKEWDSE